jgi:hypothetical protein
MKMKMNKDQLKQKYPIGTKVLYNDEFYAVIGYSEYYGLQVEYWDSPAGNMFIDSAEVKVIDTANNILEALRY